MHENLCDKPLLTIGQLKGNDRDKLEVLTMKLYIIATILAKYIANHKKRNDHNSKLPLKTSKKLETQRQ